MCILHGTFCDTGIPHNFYGRNICSVSNFDKQWSNGHFTQTQTGKKFAKIFEKKKWEKICLLIFFSGGVYNLAIKDIKPEDAGTYQAKFTNSAGEKKLEATLNVYCK